MTGSLVGALRERRQTVRALAGCRRLADLLEAEPDLEALSFYPHLLAWELAQLPADKRVVPVVLLDNFEDVGDPPASPTSPAALRLTERPFVRENPWGLWPFHCTT
ncbi:hypothetical protein [Streptomyces sp. NPDC048248]|uniref:hypothetical protein n=1 Tax=Streptomyces sp. NPDC048248 TaxID=3365523 RepID=UPI00371703B0